jgi:hypothetical protein
LAAARRQIIGVDGLWFPPDFWAVATSGSGVVSKPPTAPLLFPIHFCPASPQQRLRA